MPSDRTDIASAPGSSASLRPTFSQFANAFVPFGLLLVLAMMVPEMEHNLLKGRLAYSIWASLVLATVALCLNTLPRSEEHTSELQSQSNLVCRLLLEKKKKTHICHT